MSRKSSKIEFHSVYVSMPDGIRLATDVWLPAGQNSKEQYPVMVRFTRYWRSYMLREDRLEDQIAFGWASMLAKAGFGLVVVDCRGSGASFGMREAEYSAQEIKDTRSVYQWITQQPWSNGEVVAVGASYSANIGALSCITGSIHLRFAALRSLDFDSYSQLMAPGGISNRWIKAAYSGMVTAMDQNNYAEMMAFRNGKATDLASNILGVRPVDEDDDGSLLRSAVAEHQQKYLQILGELNLEFRDSSPETQEAINKSSIFHYRSKIEASGLPMLIRTGWQDAGTAEGALCLYNTFNNPIQIVIGPWNHGLSHLADPYNEVRPQSLDEIFSDECDTARRVLSPQKVEQGFRKIRYYTLGAHTWRETGTWPLPQSKKICLYLSAGKKLRYQSPESDQGEDDYQVTMETTTGASNRWHTQIGSKILRSPDRRMADEQLLVYETDPLESDLEVTGHPIAHLFLRCSTPDASIFLYLEDVMPDGKVVMITEGALRAIHRKVSKETPPYWMPGPYHNFMKKDASPLVPGEMDQLSFSLHPISALFRRGHRIRVAIAGADCDTFALIHSENPPFIQVQRNRMHASCIELPVIPS